MNPKTPSFDDFTKALGVSADTAQPQTSQWSDRLSSMYKNTSESDNSTQAGNISTGNPVQDAMSNINANKPVFAATPDDNLLSGTAKAFGNAPGSLYNLGKGIVSAVIHPVDTVTNVAQTAIGAGEAAAKATGASNNTSVSNEEAKFNQMKDYFAGRYGSWDNFQKTAIEDPASVAADLATLVSGGAGVVGKLGDISKISALSEAGNTLSKVAAATEPFSAAAKIATAPFKLVNRLLPEASDIQKAQVSKVLNLTGSDLSNIKKATGNDVSSYLLNNNLLKSSPEETAAALDDARKTTMSQVRDEIGAVKDTYTPDQVPRVKDALDVLSKGVNGVKGLEDVQNEIEALKNKPDYTLSDIQRAKELIDENSNIYSKTGDVGTASQSRGLDAIRKDLRGFVEDQVDKATGGKTNIRDLNNDVQTTYSLQDAIENRATRNIPKGTSNIMDAILGVGGTAINPFLGAGLVIGKHVLQSPSFRINFAKLLNKEPVAFTKQLAKEMTIGKLSDKSRLRLQNIIDTAQKYTPAIESASQAVDSTNPSSVPQ